MKAFCIQLICQFNQHINTKKEIDLRKWFLSQMVPLKKENGLNGVKIVAPADKEVKHNSKQSRWQLLLIRRSLLLVCKKVKTFILMVVFFAFEFSSNFNSFSFPDFNRRQWPTTSPSTGLESSGARCARACSRLSLGNNFLRL